MDPLDHLQDLASLSQLRESLYGNALARRAAALVGAGFSRFARLPAADSPPPPLWRDFEEAMLRRLRASPSSFGNPLRLAEEYGVAFGRAALDDLIREMVPDASWAPGEEHDRLLALPWADVLTTNWDTLLERAASRSLRARYGVVRSVPDMAVARSPRIVKLHGSLPSDPALIFTEEDYRKYPVTHAPFVNLARQVFIENELALIGFSGEDPNFIQWSGWVRDQLHLRSRRLYLVGVFDLPASRRALLESLNIAVVDLHPAVASEPEELRQKSGMRLLLEFLEAGKPRQPAAWPHVDPPPSPEKLTLSHVVHVVGRWAAARAEYPGWAVCPSRVRSRVRAGTEFELARFAVACKAEPLDELLGLAREGAWRCRLAGIAPPPWLAEKMEAILGDAVLSGRLELAGRRDIAVALAEASRAGEDDPSLERRLSLLAAIPESGNWAAFIRALRLRDTMQFGPLEAILGDIDGDDPLWKLRRAGLSAHVGRLGPARALYTAALVELRQRSIADPASRWVRSRLAWAELFARVSQGFPAKRESDPLARISSDEPTEHERDIDPWAELDSMRRELDEADRSSARDRGRTEPHFDEGIYVPEVTIWDTGEPMIPLAVSSIFFVLDALGSTGEVANVRFFSEELRRAVALAGPSRPGVRDRAASLCVTSKTSGLLRRVYRRAAIAAMPADRASALIARLRDLAERALARLESALASAGDDASDERDFWTGRLNTVAESLSRMSVRGIDDAAALHRWVLGWGRRPALRYWWTHEQYAALVERTWEAVPMEARPSFALEHLTFPLADEVSSERMERWPDPVDTGTRYTRPADVGAWERRFGELAQLAESAGKSRASALVRLAKLCLAGTLTECEKAVVGRALWARKRSDGLPAETGLQDFAILELPTPPEIDASAAFWSAYPWTSAPRFDDGWLTNVSAACAIAKRTCGRGPDAAAARRWAEAAMLWRPPPPSNRLFGALAEADARHIASFLREAALPLLEAADFTEALWDAYAQLVDAAPRALEACPSIALRQLDFVARALALVRRSLWSGDRDQSLAGALAARAWAEAAPALDCGELIEDLAALCALPRHPASSVLWQALALCAAKGTIPGPSEARVVRALEALESHADYAAWDGSDVPWEEQAPVAVAWAVRTARALRERGRSDAALTRWVDRAPLDPLPGVRRSAHAPLLSDGASEP